MMPVTALRLPGQEPTAATARSWQNTPAARPSARMVCSWSSACQSTRPPISGIHKPTPSCSNSGAIDAYWPAYKNVRSYSPITTASQPRHWIRQCSHQGGSTGRASALDGGVRHPRPGLRGVAVAMAPPLGTAAARHVSADR